LNCEGGAAAAARPATVALPVVPLLLRWADAPLTEKNLRSSVGCALPRALVVGDMLRLPSLPSSALPPAPRVPLPSRR
jgi:hypothetical protein